MNDRLPFFLHEAQISLYPADANNAAVGAPLWFGGFANHLHSSFSFEEVVVKPSGDPYGVAHHVDEAHILNFGQSWLLYKPTMVDFKPGRNVTYVLILVWMADKCWLRRIYYGVTWRSLALASLATNQFLTDQALRAQYYVDDSGSLALGGGTTPPATVIPVTGIAQPVGFFRENPLIVGEYLLGFYQWSVPVIVVGAQVIAWAPQTTPTVLALEVDGSLTGDQLVIPVGVANTEVTAAVTLTTPVAANALVRWLVLLGPGPVDAAWSCALTMQVAD